MRVDAVYKQCFRFKFGAQNVIDNKDVKVLHGFVINQRHTVKIPTENNGYIKISRNRPKRGEQ